MTRGVATVLLLLVIGTGNASGQSGVRTTSGDSLQFLPEGFESFVSVKSDDASVSGSLAYRDLSRDIGYAADVSVEATDGVSALVKNGTFRPGFRASGSFLLTSVFVDPPKVGPSQGAQSEDWVTIKVSYERSAHALFDATRPFATQITETIFHGAGVTGSYGRQIAGTIALGTTLGVRRTTNYQTLGEVDIAIERTFQNPEDGSTRLVASDKTTVREGAYVTGNVLQWRNEAFFFPGEQPRIGFGAYQTSNFSDEDLLDRTDIGFTLAFLERDSPTTSKAAVVFEFKDVTDSQNSGKSVSDRFVLSVQASLPIAPRFGW